jgi:hypothetical protein
MNEWERNDMQFLRATGAAMERCRLQCHSWMSSSFQKGHDMQKGFGFYSPHETTILFLKATLVSIWVGLDLVVLFTVYGMTPSTVQRHLPLVIAAAVVLAAGTVFSVLFIWATGSLFGRTASEGDACNVGGLAASAIQTLKRKPYHLFGAGIAGVFLMLCIVAPAVSDSLFSNGVSQPPGRANPAVVQKCSEVAELERSLFRSDERIVMAQCMLQYDKTYAALSSD